MNKELLLIIAKLKRFSLIGEMNRYEIDEIIDDLNRLNSNDSMKRMEKLMDEVSGYICRCSNEDYLLRKYIKENMEYISTLLNRSKRTIYRKLQNDGFTLVEKKIIQQSWKENDQI